MTVAWQPPPGHGIVGCAGQRGPAIEGYLLELDDGCGGEFRVNNKFLDEPSRRKYRRWSGHCSCKLVNSIENVVETRCNFFHWRVENAVDETLLVLFNL